MKLLQLNMWKGRFLPEIVAFIKREDIDIVNLQEVAGGRFAYQQLDCLAQLKQQLGYAGEMEASIRAVGQPATYMGNAILYKTPLKKIAQQTIWMHPYREFVEQDFAYWEPEKQPRCALALRFDIGGKPLWTISTHLAWGPSPADAPYKTEQAQRLYDAVSKLKRPFILSGDFNMTPDTQVLQIFRPLGRNLIVENGITNTLDAHTHKAKHLFPPGYAVDFIFVSPTIAVKTFRVLDEITLSDHRGLLLEFELNT